MKLSKITVIGNPEGMGVLDGTGVAVKVAVNDGVRLGVFDNTGVLLGSGVLVGTGELVAVGVLVGVRDGVGVGAKVPVVLPPPKSSINVPVDWLIQIPI